MTGFDRQLLSPHYCGSYRPTFTSGHDTCHICARYQDGFQSILYKGGFSANWVNWISLRQADELLEYILSVTIYLWSLLTALLALVSILLLSESIYNLSTTHCCRPSRFLQDCLRVVKEKALDTKFHTGKILKNFFIQNARVFDAFITNTESNIDGKKMSFMWSSQCCTSETSKQAPLEIYY